MEGKVACNIFYLRACDAVAKLGKCLQIFHNAQLFFFGKKSFLIFFKAPACLRPATLSRRVPYGTPKSTDAFLTEVPFPVTSS
ncbi:hypothetical protein DPMN_065551 [Dreissena polymorpha]|uniref:Uncharacterized protein n=1 Tax=Dreissena polymorpha TaxID=45954 RepID=A0A9D3YRV6_DREPO|nr:hypothetical protein DPMN_065551 [Dreissena polymorpha]